MEYLDFEIEIGQGQGREYPVAVLRSPAGEARTTITFPFDSLALQNRLQALQIALLRSGGSRRQALSGEEQTVQDFGQDLFNALVSGEIRSLFDGSRREARQQSKGLRLKIRIQAPELAALPWEFLYDDRQGEYLCLSRNTPTIRYLELPEPIPRLTVAPPLRLLAMIASPSDLPPLDVQREKQRIEIAVQDLQKKGFLELTWLEGQTWRDVMKVMRRGPWHIFHFTGHGAFDRHADEGLLALADEQGRKHLLPASDLARLLSGHFPLRLVLLNSCEGARGSEVDIYSSTAATLVRRGIAAVLAMQYEITDQAAIEFSRVFYEALADGLPVDTATTEARIAVNLAVENSLEWGTPVLYMRSPDGVLFQLASLPAHPPEPALKQTISEPPPPEPSAASQGAEVTEPKAAPARLESALENKVPTMQRKSRLPLIGVTLILSVVLVITGWWLVYKPAPPPTPPDQLSELIRKLFSSKAQVRKAAAPELIRGWQNDPSAVLALVKFATENKDNLNGIFNTFVVLNEFSSGALQVHQQEVLKFINLWTGTGQNLKIEAEAKKLLEHLGG